MCKNRPHSERMEMLKGVMAIGVLEHAAGRGIC